MGGRPLKEEVRICAREGRGQWKGEEGGGGGAGRLCS
jgi:hypothetical protein